MKRIKFIYETRSKRIFMSVLSACILIFLATGLLVDKDSSGFFFGVATGGVIYILLEFIGLFLNRNVVYVGQNHMLIRVNMVLFKIIMFDRIEEVDVSGKVQRIYLRNKTLEIKTENIHSEDVNRLQAIISKLVKP